MVLYHRNRNETDTNCHQVMRYYCDGTDPVFWGWFWCRLNFGLEEPLSAQSSGGCFLGAWETRVWVPALAPRDSGLAPQAAPCHWAWSQPWKLWDREAASSPVEEPLSLHRTTLLTFIWRRWRSKPSHIQRQCQLVTKSPVRQSGEFPLPLVKLNPQTQKNKSIDWDRVMFGFMLFCL